MRAVKNKLVSINMLSIIIHGMLGVRILTLPRDVAKFAGRDAWISMIIIYFVVLATSYTFYWISKQYPGLNFSEINEVVLGKVFSKITMTIIAVYLISSAGLSLRVFGDSIKVFLLEKTPMIVVMTVMILTAVYCIKSGIDTLSIVFDILLPFVLIFFIIIMILTISALEPKNIFPVFHHGIGEILRGSLEIVDPILTCGIIAYIMPYFGEQAKVKRYIFLSITISSILYLIIIVLSIMVFGEVELQYQVYPTLNLGKAVQLKTEIFERTESLFMIVWIPNALSSIILYYLVSIQNLKVLFKTKKDSIFLYGLIPACMLIALIPQNTRSMLRYLEYNAYLAQFLNLVYVPVFAIIVYLKTRRRKNA
jgi:spore germination protein